MICACAVLTYSVSYSIPSLAGMYMTNMIVCYNFTFDEHPLPKAPHGNSARSTPYKQQLHSTRDLLKTAAEMKKAQEAFV